MGMDPSHQIQSHPHTFSIVKSASNCKIIKIFKAEFKKKQNFTWLLRENLSKREIYSFLEFLIFKERRMLGSTLPLKFSLENNHYLKGISF